MIKSNKREFTVKIISKVLKEILYGGLKREIQLKLDH